MVDETGAADRAVSLVASMHVCTLATCADGEPHAVSLLYAHAGLRLFWLSDPASLHSRHIEASPEGLAAVTIAADQDDFRTIRGLQMRGRARRLIAPGETEHAMDLLARRYPYLREADRPAEIAAALAKASLYSFVPSLITLIDNRGGLGGRITFSPAGRDNGPRR